MNWQGGAIVLALAWAGSALKAEDPLQASEPAAKVVLAVHGGTGIEKAEMTPEAEKAYRAGLEQALRTGYAVLQKADATSLDAIEAAIRVLEDDPMFNAGRGAVFTREGRNELDASIMEGKTKRAGAVAGVTIVKNPITAARAVMEKSKHVLLIGRGAEVFATKAGLDIVDPSWFWTERRWKQIEEIWKEEQRDRGKQGNSVPARKSVRELGTVGAVALDRAGNLAAGTSTGGMTGKQFGRVGDSPIIGAGTYADNSACAVSATGHGEFFIRFAVAHEIVSLMKHKKVSVQGAADEVVNKTLKEVGGEGGVIALDAQGRAAFPFNSEGLYRGYVTERGEVKVMLYED